MRKSLNLKRESLTALSSDELGAVAGGAYDLSHIQCDLTDNCGHGRSFDTPCPTIPVNPCLSLDRPCIAIE